MNLNPITIEVKVNASSQTVWNALTNKEQMKEWYFDLNEFEAEKDFEFQFYGGTEEKQFLHLCKVMEAIAGSKLSHTWTYENIPGETLVTWEIMPAEHGKTTVRLTHEGLENFPADNKDLARENFVEGWKHIVNIALKEYVEKRSES